MSKQTHTVSTELALRLVADPCRRSILSQLIDSEETVIPTDTLVDRIDHEKPPPESTATHTDPVLIDVHHTHLPKLAEANVIEYDSRTKTVRYIPNERVERVFQFVTEELE
ncbi:DUF7344 domain-containing protein [Halorubrum sp. DTA98]|uniref:DUF7344 domain-containing protein n=1 Tax=Halorubrum sp. DTA98 TaxID=3402163 RepID=UPI003AAD36FA